MTSGNGEGQAGRIAEPAMSPRTRVAILTVRRALIMMANALGELVGQPPVRIGAASSARHRRSGD